MPNSTVVVIGDDVLAAQYNALRNDVLSETTGHDHDGGASGGHIVDHADLVESEAMKGRIYTHTEIDAHIDATDGVHGMSSAIKFLGCGPNQLVAIAGTLESPSSAGTCAFSEDGLIESARLTLTSVVAIILACQGSAGGEGHNSIPEWITVDAAAGLFTYQVDHPGKSAFALSFLIIGKK